LPKQTEQGRSTDFAAGNPMIGAAERSSQTKEENERTGQLGDFQIENLGGGKIAGCWSVVGVISNFRDAKNTEEGQSARKKFCQRAWGGDHVWGSNRTLEADLQEKNVDGYQSVG